ncbi:cytochrome c class I [Gemmatirosa kalamazoonensis]|uniref:Cytochrome c class I n=1 Tax=Gemmatirosa kalamazoonensis TaxID=861299 RepID=W0RJB4_9BACT|nr:c-type cytochrome [Gemmatirosa kalamazoonensis]AHG89508.1 cytochrome c class I [Gemmatirosa kalamazoonensis]
MRTPGSTRTIITLALATLALGCDSTGGPGTEPTPEDIAKGQQIFRMDTFGDEQFWTDTLHLERVVQQAVDPTTALAVGLKVDMDALPADLVQAIQAGKVDLKSPATTLALLKLDAVVGVKGTVQSVGGRDTLTRLGITCALCHSTVDDAFAKGIGHRKDGWPNHDLNVGAIVALSPVLPASAKAVFNSWGPGMYDPRFNIDGQNTPLVIPPAYGLAQVRNETYTAEGPVSYWNAYVAVTQMHAHGTFSDPRLGINIVQTPDLVTSKLPALRAYQFSLQVPPAPAGSFDAAAAARGQVVFNASCASCHVGATLTDNNSGVLHAPSETGVDARYALRTPTKRYRTTPLRGLWQHAPYFHDGSAKTLADVVEHYDTVRGLHLSAAQKQDLVAYLKTL